MAKKKRTAKTSTKSKRRANKIRKKAIPSRSGESVATETVVAAAGVNVAQMPPLASFRQNVDLTAQQIAASQRKLPAAVLSTLGSPHALLAGAGNLVADAFVIPASVPITPTVYPDNPHGTVIVQNHVTINIQTHEFNRFNKNIEALIGELRLSNEIAGEVRDQLVSELSAGRELITGPKPQRDLIDLLLVKPLKYLIEKSGSAIIGKLAGDALEWLLRMLR